MKTTSRMPPQIIVRDAAVACAGGEIVFVGTERDLREAVKLRPDGREVDAGGGTLLPGFVDAHTHLVFAGERGDEFARRRTNSMSSRPRRAATRHKAKITV